MAYKKIYAESEALVSDELINSSDEVINQTLQGSKAGMVIYTAGYKIIKQKSLDNKWIAMHLGGSGGTGTAGADGKDGITPLLQKSSTAIQVSYDNGSTYDDLVLLSEIKGAKGDTGAKGDKGTTGATGATGAKGDKGDKGDKGEAFTYADFTPEQLAALKGEKGDTGATGAKGDKGETGAAGAKGDKGSDGKGVTAIALITDAEGKITGGTVTFSDSTTASITITSATE